MRGDIRVVWHRRRKYYFVKNKKILKTIDNHIQFINFPKKANTTLSDDKHQQMNQKMVLFDSEDESLRSIHIILLSFIVALFYFVWKSTQVREIEFTTSSQFPISNFATGSTTEENLTNSVENMTDSIFVEASESFNNQNNVSQDETDGDLRISDTEITEEELIIREMDRDIPSSSSSRAAECRLRKRIVHESQPSTSSASNSSDNNQQREEDKILIKLKYLNDEIKTVNAYLNETIGSFKRRQFQVELESKLIKLIFNGQILEDDRKSLSQCGLFSEAVVHCLILQKKNVMTPVSNQMSPVTRNTNNGGILNSTNPLEWNGTLFIYIIGMILVSVTLVFCWYCRIQYSSYFSWYSTVGLILMTSLFVIMIPLLTLLK
ncbi:CLUMA_CG016524, isoform A, partial [Clunio marinus]